MSDSFENSSDLKISKSDLPEYIELSRFISKFEQNQPKDFTNDDAIRLISILKSFNSEKNELSAFFSNVETDLVIKSLNYLQNYLEQFHSNSMIQIPTESQRSNKQITEENETIKEELRIANEKINNLMQYQVLYNSFKAENEALKLDQKVMEEIKAKYEKRVEKLSGRLKEFKTALKNMIHDYTAVQQQNEKDKARLQFLERKMQSTSTPDEFQIKNELQSKENELELLKQLFTNLEKQYDEQAEELSKQSEQRNQLISTIAKLQQICQTEENLIDQQKQEIKYLNQTIERNNQHNPTMVSLSQAFDANNEDFEKKLFTEILENLPKQYLTKQLKDILTRDSKNNSVSKIIDSFNEIYQQGLSVSDKERNQFNEQIQMLNNCVLSELEFIEEMSNNKQIQQWILKPIDADETRTKLIEQSKRIANFILMNDIQYTGKRMNFFKRLLQTSNNMSTFPNEIEEFLERFSHPQTASENELFILLKQCLCANDILRCLTVECRSRNLLQEHQIEAMKEKHRQLELENEEKETTIRSLVSDNEKEESKSKKELEKCQKQIRSIKAVLNYAKEKCGNEGNHQEISDILSIVGSDELNSSDIDNIKERRSQQLKVEHKESQKMPTLQSNHEETQLQKISSCDSLNSHLSESESESEEEESKSSLNKASSSIDEVLNQVDHEMDNREQMIAQKNEEILNLTKEIQKRDLLLEQAASEIEQQKIISENQINANQIKLQNELAEMKKKYDKEKEEVILIMNNSIDSLQETNTKIAKKYVALQKKLESLKSKYMTISEQLKQKLEKCESEKGIQEKENEESKAKILELQDKLSSMEEKILLLQNEKKNLEYEIKSQKEKSKRKEQVIADQQRIKDIATNAKYESLISIEAHKLIDFQQNLCEKLECSPSEIEEMIKKLLEELKEYQKLKNQYSILQFEYDSCKELVEKHIENEKERTLKICIEDLIKEYVDKSNSLKQLQEDMKQFDSLRKDLAKYQQSVTDAKDWSNWARRVHIYVIDTYTCMKTDNEIRQDLESIIFSSTRGISLRRTIDSLRAQKIILKKENEMRNSLTQSGSKSTISTTSSKSNVIQDKQMKFKVLFIAILSTQKLMKSSGFSCKFDAIANNINTYSKQMPPLFSNFILGK